MHDETPGGETDPGPAGQPALAQAWLVIVLTAIYTLNFVDRGSLTLIVNPIKADLHVSDLQMSFLLGLSFVALYSFLSIPAGYIADFVSRRWMIAGAVSFWSAMTMLCGLAGSYGQLFAGRMGLGVGEAALPPAAYSLLRDGVDAPRRARAFSIYQMGPLLGASLGAVIGAALFAAAGHGAFRGVPVLGALRPWQVVIALPGLVGLPIALLPLTVREPARPRSATIAGQATFGETFAYMKAHGRLYLAVFAGVTLASLNTGWSAWLPAAIGRTWTLSPAEIGAVLGPLGLVLTPVAYVGLGWLMDRPSRDGRAAGALRVSAIGVTANIVPSLAVLLAPGKLWMWTALAVSMLVTGAAQIACGAALAEITPSRLMGKATSFYFLAGNLLGLAIGPTLYALAAQVLFHGPKAIVGAMLVCYPVVAALDALVLWLAARETGRWWMGQRH